MSDPRTTNRSWWTVLALASLPLAGFWLYGLFDLDEGYYAAVVAEMNRRHEWITPYFNGHPWFEKPILLYWMAKPSVLVFGQEIGPRLPSVLATISLIALCGFYLRKRVNESVGMWAMAMLGSSLIVIVIGRMMITDALLDLCICGAFLSFYESLVGDRKWRLLTAFLLGLAVLAKGPVSLPLFLALAIWTCAAERDLRPAFKGWWLLGLGIVAGTVCLWYVPAYIENGQVFVQKFFIEQNLQRFGGGDEAHKVPILLWPIYYPLILFVGLLPWSIWLPNQWLRCFDHAANPFQRFLARWAFVVFLFFTISGTKLPHYILPAVPPLIMIGAIEWGAKRKTNWPLWISLSAGLCLVANAAFIFWYHAGGFAEVHSDARSINQLVDGHEGAVFTYQLARVANAKGLSLNDTSNPSLGFYLNGEKVRFTEAASLPELESGLESAENLVDRDYIFVLSRPGRLLPEDYRALGLIGFRLTPLATPTRRRYIVYKVERRPAGIP